MQAKRCGRTQGMAMDGAQEVRVHVMGAEMQGMAVDGAQEARLHMKGGHATRKGARPHKRGLGHMKGGWATRKGAGPCKRVPGSQMCGEEGQGHVGMVLVAGEAWAGCRGGASNVWGLRTCGSLLW